MATTLLDRHNQSQQASWRPRLDDAFLEPLFVVLTLIGIALGEVLARSHVVPSALLTVHLLTYAFGGYYALRAIIEALRQR
ncbi:MAG TPA: hypothetical protein VFT99_25690, partial [Roseiflexaceae bacterium]|nr:hypothetical protein [Roseiflexaceae bacterium]